MNSFVYNIPTKVYFGENQFGHLGEELSKYGKRVLMTYGGGSIKRIGLYDRLMAEMEQAGLEVYEYSGIDPNPRIDSVREGAAICKEHGIDAEAFPAMAKKACKGDKIAGFKTLYPEDVEKIYEMCL